MSLQLAVGWTLAQARPGVEMGSDEEFFFPLVSVAAIEEGFSRFSLLVQTTGLVGQVGACGVGQELSRNKREEGDTRDRHPTRKREERNAENRGNQDQGMATWAEKGAKQNRKIPKAHGEINPYLFSWCYPLALFPRNPAIRKAKSFNLNPRF